MNMHENSNRAILVTGGSRGLGLAMVRTLLELGYSVATCSRGRSPELEALEQRFSNGRFLWTACSVGSERSETAAVTAFLEWLEERKWYGLVNNAGIAGEGILATYPNADTARIIEVNLLGAIRMARHAARSMLRSQGGGRIVNISSIVGSRGYNGLTAYSASKAGMDGMTRALARELGRRSITVNSIAPGYLTTDMTTSLADRQRGQIVNRTPLGRLGTVDDVVPVLTFLLSDQASFITGQTLVIDGGISC